MSESSTKPKNEIEAARKVVIQIFLKVEEEASELFQIAWYSLSR